MTMSRFSRPEASFIRQHTGGAPEPSAMPRTWLRIAAEAASLTALLAALVMLTCVI